MTDYTWPATLVAQSCVLSRSDSGTRYVAPYSGYARFVSRPGGHWRMTMRFNALSQADAHTLEAFIYKLNGTTNRAVVPDHSYQMQGTGSGTPVVSGASQTGYTLLTSGWTPGETVLKAGDRVNLGAEMMVVAEDVTSSGYADIYLRDHTDTIIYAGSYYSDAYLRDEADAILYDEGSPQDEIEVEDNDPIEVSQGYVTLTFTHPMRTSPADASSVSLSPTLTCVLAEFAATSAIPSRIKSCVVELEESL